MTALPATRRRATAVAAGLSLIALVGAGALTYAGTQTLWHSTGGSAAAPSVPELHFPSTGVAVVGGVDDDGTLASVTVFVAEPGRQGGTVVDVPVNADVSGGAGDERQPLAEAVAGADADTFRSAVEAILALSVDAAELADADRLAELLGSVGAVSVDLPRDVTDTTGTVVATAGSAELDPAALASVLTTAAATGGGDQLAQAAAVWSAVAARTGPTGPAAPGPPIDDGGVDSVDGVVAAVLGGPVQHWTLRADAPARSDNPDRLDVVVVDRAEAALVFGQIAPARTAAPSAGLSVRLEVGFSDAELAGTGLTNASIAYDLINVVNFIGGNVRSVDTTPGSAPGRTEVEPGRRGINTRGLDEVLGEFDVIDPDIVIAGIDVVIRPGVNYLTRLATGPPPTTATVSSVPATIDVVEPAPSTTGT